MPGRVTVIGALDNLTKGSSGQAMQNANLMLGCDETAGLMLAPLFRDWAAFEIGQRRRLAPAQSRQGTQPQGG